MTQVADRVPAPGTGRLKLLALFLIAGMPVVAAMVMYFGQFMVPDGRTNHGELILPPLNAGHLVDVDDAIETPDPWTLLTWGTGTCNQSCQESLYTIRQVNVAVGRDASRVRHMLLILDQDDGSLAAIKEQFPKLQIRQVSSEEVNAVFQKAELGSEEHFGIYIVDPLGNLMMRYRPGQSGNDVLDDLKKLLRVSKIG